METMQELIPFAREMLSQKPRRGLLKIYLLGSLFAVLGTIIGLVETVCQPFSSGHWMDAEKDLVLAWEQRTVEAETQNNVGGQEDAEEEEEEEEAEEELAYKNGAMTLNMTLSKTHKLSHRSMATRLHAS
ncbi:G0/G1 switch protein 2 [Paralichthys olivaceus]|uniref:G0/G1 switch protein 2 n=1 Tax=Paralichthys olivaceus TaxID=8255 RepID=UPI00097DD50A|nr:PREDICTED: G0/G1 switch protein 2 [Paralichthys olivaceus]XP_019959827.1 PREDICTED: G0/G1 switch protein 2 [Paralichthys olivaceus]XP_019959828.1 PREDICTED: G0/G1 switch protein 2 [Paralichthys olivaceus]